MLLLSIKLMSVTLLVHLVLVQRCIDLLWINMIFNLLLCFKLCTLMFRVLPTFHPYLSTLTMLNSLMITLDIPDSSYLNKNLSCLLYLSTLRIWLKLNTPLKSKSSGLIMVENISILIFKVFVLIMVFFIKLLALTFLNKMVSQKGNIGTL